MSEKLIAFSIIFQVIYPFLIPEKKKEFCSKRKHHYDEAYNIKLAKQLIEQELREAEEEEEEERRRETLTSQDGCNQPTEGASVDNGIAMQTGD